MWKHTQSVRNFSLSQCRKQYSFSNFKLTDEKLRKATALIFSEM